MKKNIIVTLSCLCLFYATCAQSSKKGFKLLEKLEYDKSRSAFNEMVAADNQNPAANFGLALICSDERSPYFNLIEAWSHCRILQQHADKLLQEDLEIIGEYFVNTELRASTRPVKKKIEYAVATMEAHLIKYIREENNLALTYEVIEKFPDFRHYGNVVHIRNQLEFRKYEKQNALEGYLEFIEKFPDAAQIEKAIRYRNKLAYEKAAETNTLEAYVNFIHEYPDADEYNLAVKNRNAAAFKRARDVNTMQGYEAFIVNYPGSLEVAEAKLLQKQLLYEYAKKIKTLEAYDEFIRKYPEGQQYIDIFNLKSLNLGMKYISASSITSSNLLWARSFDLGGEAETTAVIESLENNRYFLASTSRKNDTSYTDIWLLCLDAEGKMIWNKTIGETFDDQVLYSSVNQNNEIILAGYTWGGTDTSARETWLLKQAADGRNIWSQKLGKWTINSLSVSQQNNILLGGYQQNDSLRKNYRIMVLNDAGRRLWNRTYKGAGEVKYMGIMPDQSVLVVADNWTYRMNDKGYIMWEYIPSPECVNHCGIVSGNGEYFVCGIRHETDLIITKFGADGKKRWDRQLVFSDSLSAVHRMLPVGSVSILLFAAYKDGANGLIWIQNLTGDMVKKVRIEDGVINDALLDDGNNLWMLIEDANTVLIKSAGADF